MVDGAVMGARTTDPGRSTLASPARLAALRATGLLDSDVEESFDRLTRLAVRHVRVPAAFISLVDEHRDFYKSACGFGEPLATARELQGPTFCHYTIRSAAPLVIPDTAADARYRDVPTVKSLGVKAYVGIPIMIGEQSIGAFCAIDTRPRQWTDDEIHLLTELALSAQREMAIRASERAAQETAARLTVAMEAARLGAWTHDVGSRTRWHAAHTNASLGRPAVDGPVAIDDWLAQIHPDDRARVQAAFERATHGDGQYAAEYRIRWPDGSEHWVCAAGMLLREAGGAPTKLVGTLEDITTRKRSEVLTRESEERLRAFIEAVPLLAWLNHPDGATAFFNRRWYDYSGQDERLATSERWMEIIHPDDAARVHALRESSVATSAPYEVELRLRRRDGAYRWHVARVAPSLGPDGEVLSWAGGALDVDDRHRLEAELRVSEARFRLVQDASPDGSVLLQPLRDASGVVADFVVTYANASASRILLDSSDPITGRRLSEAFPESAERTASYARVLETGDPLLTETYFTRKDLGRGLRITAVRVDDRVHVAFADLTDRLRAETERERLLVAERQAHASARTARREAEEANAVKAHFLATMSHELRTPLNAIGGYAQLIELGVHGPVSPAQAEALARIQRSQKHLLSLVTEVLNYAKIEAGAVSFHLADVPALEIVRGVEALVAPQARAKEIALVVEPSVPALSVRADPEKAQQIVLNLLSNAVKFTEQGGRVHVRCAAAATVADARALVEIRVEDTGRGISPADLATVFDPFVQVGRELTSEQAGTGLGLAISRDLARGMGGDVVATSEEGVGSLFVLTLPRA